MGFKSQNLAAVVRSLTRYGDRTDKQAGDVMERSLERAYGRQQELCPVGVGSAVEEGGLFHMKDHVTHDLSEDRRRYVLGWERADFDAAILPFYPPFVEFGTSKMAAQPSLLPAMFEEEPRLLNDLKRVYR